MAASWMSVVKAACPLPTHPLGAVRHQAKKFSVLCPPAEPLAVNRNRDARKHDWLHCFTKEKDTNNAVKRGQFQQLRNACAQALALRLRDGRIDLFRVAPDDGYRGTSRYHADAALCGRCGDGGGDLSWRVSGY